MSVMVLNCWSSRKTAGPAIFFFKFVELTAVNLWAISSLSIAIVITRIVQAFSHLRRVPSVVGSVQTVWRCTALAIALSCCSVPFWNDVMVTGAYFWVTNSSNAKFSRWISLSFVTTQAVVGILMAMILLFNVTGKRRASLIVCCKTSKRVKIYFVLTILGTCVYLYNGAVLSIDEFAVFKIGKKEMVMIGWCSKYIHVIADTLVLFNAFQAIDKRNVAVEADGGSRAHQSAGPSSSEHSRMTVPGPSWLCDSLPRTASGTHNVTTDEIRSPGSFASAGSFSSPKISIEIGDDEDNGEPSSSPLPRRSMFGRGSSRGNTPIHNAIGNSSNRPEISPCSLAPAAGCFSAGGGKATSLGRAAVRTCPPDSGGDVESGWASAPGVSTT
eukprot:jgi/Undpi1/7601/HiC_scaffold_23.g10074.m1